MTDDRFGWARSDGCVGLSQAVRALRNAECRRPTDDDRHVSTFPLTPAAREALRLSHEREPRPSRHRVVNRGGEIVREPPPANVVPIGAARKRR